VLGYIPTGPLASGDLTVSREGAVAAVDRLGAPLGLSTVEAARGIHELANGAMMRALRAVSTEKGRDPGDFVLIAYGGSGPVHAAALAAELGVRTAIVPPLAGLFSAAGLLVARAEFHDVRFCKVSAREPDVDVLAALDAEMREVLTTSIGDGVEIEWQRQADVRYRGQNWSVSIDFPGEVDAAGVEGLIERFEAEHEQLYATRLEPGSPVDIRALRLIALGPDRARLSLPQERELPGGAAATRDATFSLRQGTVQASVRTRASLGAEPTDGPLLIDEYDTTVIVPPGWTVRVDPSTRALVLDHVATELQHEDDAGHGASISRRLVANALETAADEMATTIFRTAHSAVVRDAMDFSAALCGPTGETVAQAVTVPLQLGSIPNAMKTLFRRFGDEFRPGDVYLVNDPFDGASHNPDIFIVKPSFEGETLLGFAVTVAHHGDIGGRVPGSCACDSTEVYQEGLRMPWLRLYAAGEPVEDIFAVLRANVRIPRELMGDLSAQVAACHIGDRSLQELARRHGAPRLASLMAELIDHTEALLRREIASWPDGTVEFTDFMDSDGIDVSDVPLHVKLTVRGDELIADFSESAPMVRGALNCTPSFAEAAVYHTVMAASAIDIPRTAGATRPITVITKPGTVTHVLLPGASSMRGVTGYRLSDVMNGALAQLIPDRVPAAGEGGSTLAFFTGKVDGEPYVYSELVVGTWGGRPVADGNDGLANPCASIANIPVELAESDWPIMIERYGLVTDSGGAGRYRGGLAIERVWRVLEPNTSVHVRSDRQIHRPYGLVGGHEGGPSSSLIFRTDGTLDRMPPMFVSDGLARGDVLHHRMPGGGGWGDPFDREPEAVAQDVLDEKVSVSAAREHYGVVVSRDGAIDTAATDELRRARTAVGESA
jgi:N-methylhydantoinase B/oxoprolinase/acetone carboxylase alpha subunit